MLKLGHEVVLRSAPLTLEVKAKPATSAGWFLPAKAVTLTASWDPANPAFRVGEAVTRHVRIQALGANEVQLPDLALPQVNGARIYLEKSAAGSIDTPDGTAAVRDFTYSVVPTTGGALTLPEITVDWFDTTAETARTATLAPETITVEGPVATTKPQQATPVEPSAPPTVTSCNHDITASGWLVALVIAMISVIAAAAYFHRHGSPRRGTIRKLVAPVKPSGASGRKSALNQVEAACQVADPQAAYRGVLKWRHAVPGDTAMHDSTLWQRFPDLGTSWQDLEARVFSEHGQGNWDAQQFLQDLRAADRMLRQSARRGPHAILPSLYASDEHMPGKRKKAV